MPMSGPLQMMMAPAGQLTSIWCVHLAGCLQLACATVSVWTCAACSSQVKACLWDRLLEPSSWYILRWAHIQGQVAYCHIGITCPSCTVVCSGLATSIQYGTHPAVCRVLYASRLHPGSSESLIQFQSPIHASALAVAPQCSVWSRSISTVDPSE